MIARMIGRVRWGLTSGTEETIEEKEPRVGRQIWEIVT
jgi:hypothetical protein